MLLLALGSAAVLIAIAALAALLDDAARARHLVYGTCLIVSLVLLAIALFALFGIYAGSPRPSFHSAFRGLERIFVWMRFRRFFSP